MPEDENREPYTVNISLGNEDKVKLYDVTITFSDGNYYAEITGEKSYKRVNN